MGTVVELREVREEDLDALFRFQLDPEANRMAAFTSKDPTDRAAFDAHRRKILADPSLIMRAVWSDGQIVGSVGSFVMFEMRQVAYWIGKEFWGRGLATAALQALLREESTRPIFGSAAFDNEASQRVLQKCGFVRFETDRGFANARGEEIEEHIYRLD